VPGVRHARLEDGPRTICPNRFECPAQLKGRIVHFGARHALDIEGLGEETARQLVEMGLVSELAELFDLAPEQLMRSRASPRSRPRRSSPPSTRARSPSSRASWWRSGSRRSA
jgi:DNA ligase (NAD+)